MNSDYLKDLNKNLAVLIDGMNKTIESTSKIVLNNVEELAKTNPEEAKKILSLMDEQGINKKFEDLKKDLNTTLSGFNNG